MMLSDGENVIKYVEMMELDYFVEAHGYHTVRNYCKRKA